MTDQSHEALEGEQRPDTVRATIQERERELHTLRDTLNEQERALAGIKEAIHERENALHNLQTLLSEHDDRLAELRPEANGGLLALDDESYKIALALTLANAAYDALLVVDPDTRIIAINTSAELLFNAVRPIGQRLVDVTQMPTLEMMVEDALANEEEVFEEQLTLERRFYKVRTQVIRRAGNSFIGIALQDVSELVRLNRARREMVANISHELRTPIANIRLIIEGLFHEQEKPKRKQSASALRAIARETDSLLWLVQELFDLSMIETGQAIMRMLDVPVNELIDEAVVRLEDQCENKGVTVVVDAPDELRVLADRDQARRVLINLLHNAIKWSPPNEKITICAEAAGDWAIFSVGDEGPGVPEEHRERIFERLYQVDASRSAGDGMGLGLAICRHIVDAHEGRIWVENNDASKNGTGACFRFTLPIAEEF